MIFEDLALDDKGGSAMLPWRENNDPQEEQVTVRTVFFASTGYIPAAQPFMVNYIVHDLDVLIAA